MTTLRMFIFLGFLVAIALPLIDAAVFRPRRANLSGSALLRGERLIYLIFIAAFALMALSSLGMLLVGERMHRWMLIIHMSVAPLYAVALTALALLWAEQNTLERTAHSPAETRFHPAEKLAFWIVVLSGLATILTAMLSMMSWFGSDAQETLLDLHRYSGLILLIAAVFHAYRLLTPKYAEVTPPARA